MWNKCQRSKIQAVEMSFLRGGCSVNRMDGECNGNAFFLEDLVCLVGGEGMSCRVVEVVKHSTLR